MATGTKKRGLMGLENCIEILEGIVDKLKQSAHISHNLWGDVADDLWKHMSDAEILIHITSGILGSQLGDDETKKPIGREIAFLCISLSQKNESDALMCVGSLLCEIDKFFGAKNDEKTREQIISAMWCLANGKRNKKTGLNIILGALLLAEPYGRTNEENNQILLKIQKALAGVI